MIDVNKQLKAISKKIKKEYGAEKIILFGSYARGEETKDSDIDLLIIAPTKERFFERMATIKRLIRDLRNGLTISSIILKPEELNRRISINDKFINEILEKGIEL